MKIFKKVLFASFIAFFLAAGFANAQTNIPRRERVEYDERGPIDSDLDGLTDQAEIQIYHTDPNNPDTDGDGYFDGAEVIAGSDPLDPNSTPESIKKQLQNFASTTQTETPWPWYVSRASGLIAFALLYISMFLVLTIRLPFFRKIFAPAYALNAHGWIALQATIFALAHGLVLIFDKFIKLTVVNVFVPFTSAYQPLLVALGTISFYLMVLLVATSYGRKHMSFKTWRTIHFFNIGLYFIVIIHALFLGTDLKVPIFRDIFVVANAFLIILMLSNMFWRIKTNLVKKSTTQS
ncbi:MAG: ferric reductase-like transmembrane domain-containing protein [Candidatus Moranbacteria bacterium]|nr:ferric reductase-like transmembrane domain-containing protein [Candidatus Moranbacteria bacterium]